MAQSVSLWGALYSNVPAILLPKSPSGTARFTDVSDTTAVAETVTSGNYFYNAAGERTPGNLVIQHYYTGSSAPSSSLGVNGDIYLQTS